MSEAVFWRGGQKGIFCQLLTKHPTCRDSVAEEFAPLFEFDSMSGGDGLRIGTILGVERSAIVACFCIRLLLGLKSGVFAAPFCGRLVPPMSRIVGLILLGCLH